MSAAEPVPSLEQAEAETALLERIHELEHRVAKAEERRRALLHIMGDLNDSNKRLADQRKAMLHILGDYEADRSRLAKQTERLDNSRRALLHILSDSHDSNLRLESSRKAMIHIMGDLRETTAEIERREHELRDKQEQLIQAGKLATLGELTTGIAHELNNPLNNIGLFVGNAIDRIELGRVDPEVVRTELGKAMEQVRKATEIISHLRTFGRAATIVYEPVEIGPVIERSLSLMQEQLRLRQITVEVEPGGEPIVVHGNEIQLEQVFVNLLTNAKDALADREERRIWIASRIEPPVAVVTFADSGPGVDPALEQRIFDPFFTTKEVGAGTGLGLSITYGIVTEHAGTIVVGTREGGGAEFTIELPLAEHDVPEP
jgi:C4-dicarboxylate-specific signal transduction histidine kinase